MKRAYGWRPSPPDTRDKVADPSGLTLLPEVDLRKGPMPLVYDQGQLGSCTANAVCAALQFDASLDLAPKKARRRSRLDLYYGERSLEGSLGEGDTGAIGRDGFKYAQQTGVLLETAWPYTDDTFNAQFVLERGVPDGSTPDYNGPPPAGRRHKLAKPYAAVTKTEAHIKAVLSNRQTVAIGFTVYDAFESPEVAQSGIVDLPGPSEYPLGGHEVLLVGYLASSPGYALARNSWGSGWGLGGYFLWAWEYILSSYTSDLRTIVRAVV